MSWSSTTKLYINVDAAGGYPLLAGTSNVAAQKPIFVQGDRFPLQLWFRRPGSATGASTAIALADTSSVILSGKLKDALDADELLFCADSFTETGSGADTYYSGDLILDTEPLNELFAASASDQITIVIDLTITLGATRYTFQFEAFIKRRVYNSEGAPEETPAPDYYTKSQADALFMVRGAVGASWRISPDGLHLQLWDYAASAWLNIHANNGELLTDEP